MILNHSFKVDLFNLRETKDKGALMQKIITSQAMSFGITINQAFPFIKNEKESFDGELPSLALNKDHEYFDLYESELVVVRKSAMDQIVRELNSDNPDKQAILKLLSYEYIPLDSDNNNSGASSLVY